MFYNRKKELEQYHSLYKNLDSGVLSIIYGRRRLGKTSFIKKVLEKTRGVYFFVNNTNKKELLEGLSNDIYDQTQERYMFSDWNDFFSYLLEKSEDKFVFVMDEFPRLKASSPDFFTKFQDFWDSKLKDKKILLVAIGSSMSAMYDIFLDKEAALYGRVGHKLLMQPFKYKDFREMFSDISEEKKVELYSVFGGTPHFLSFVKPHRKKKIIDIITEIVLSDTSVLREEPLNFITMELKKETKYNAILHAISKTNGEREEIIKKSGVGQKDIDYYLFNLTELLGIIEKQKPIFYQKTKKTRYLFKDNFFLFWYNYIFPNLSLIELENIELLKHRISKTLHPYIGKRFEQIVKELLILHNGKHVKGLKLEFDQIGPWWGKNNEGNIEEIDLVLNNTKTKKTIFCEVKWGKYSKDILEQLDKKAKLVTPRKADYLIVTKEGFKKGLSLKEIQKLFDSL